jgi:hypothetical protein
VILSMAVYTVHFIPSSPLAPCLLNIVPRKDAEKPA